MMRAGEPVQRQHAKYGGERGAEHGQFKGDGNKGGPTVERASANVERIGDDADPVLKEKATETTGQAANQRDKRHVVSLQSERFGEPLNRKRRIRFDAAIAGLASFLHRVDKLVLGLELGHDPVNMGAMFHHSWSSEVSATNSRISAIEIAGITRTKRNSNITKRPMVPANVA